MPLKGGTFTGSREVLEFQMRGTGFSTRVRKVIPLVWGSPFYKTPEKFPVISCSHTDPDILSSSLHQVRKLFLNDSRSPYTLIFLFLLFQRWEFVPEVLHMCFYFRLPVLVSIRDRRDLNE